MKIAILTSGSRGDVQPFVAIGIELVKRGHEVRIATEQRMQGLVEEFGLAFFKIAGDPTAILWTKDAQVMLREGRVMELMQRMEQHNAGSFQQALEDYEAACQGMDIVVSAPLCITQSFCICEKYRIPWVPVLLGPTLKTGNFPLFFISSRSMFFGWLNKFTYSLMFWLLWRNEKLKINTWRQQKLGLPPLMNSTGIAGILDTSPVNMIVGCNRNLIPGEKKPEDWPATAEIVGFLFVPTTPEENIDKTLREFVSAPGGKIVYLGFGSMPAPNPLALVKAAISIVNRLQCRAILCAGWTELREIVEGGGEGNQEQKIVIPPELLIIKSAPHDWLFPRCNAIVHHCGVGTCASALRSGVPSVPCPVLLDQPFNASRLFNLGTSSQPIPFHTLTLENLCQAIQFVLATQSLHTKAKAIAEEIAKEEEERGVKAAAKIIENASIPACWTRNSNPQSS